MNKVDKLDVLKFEIEFQILEKGIKSIQFNKLLNYFDYKNNVPSAISKIKNFIKHNNFYCTPEISENLKRKNTKITIRNFEIKKSKDEFRSEKELEKYILENNLLEKIGISAFENQAALRGTKDKMDYLGKDKSNNDVIIELKIGDGGKSTLEQLFRYKGILLEKKILKNPSKIKMVLITGAENPKIKYALKGMFPSQALHFKWYMYNYDKSIENPKKALKFREISI